LAFKTVICVLASVGGAVSGTAALSSELDDAKVADARHDYGSELQLLRSLAAAGNARGQAMLGDMYYFGAGVAEDYAEAARWYRMAAERGDAESQFNIGVMYECGTGVPQDLAQARAWLTLSAVQGDTATSRLAIELRRDLDETLTSDQIDAARDLERAWAGIREDSSGKEPNHRADGGADPCQAEGP